MTESTYFNKFLSFFLKEAFKNTAGEPVAHFSARQGYVLSLLKKTDEDGEYYEVFDFNHEPVSFKTKKEAFKYIRKKLLK